MAEAHRCLTIEDAARIGPKRSTTEPSDKWVAGMNPAMTNYYKPPLQGTSGNSFNSTLNHVDGEAAG